MPLSYDDDAFSNPGHGYCVGDFATTVFKGHPLFWVAAIVGNRPFRALIIPYEFRTFHDLIKNM